MIQTNFANHERNPITVFVLVLVIFHILQVNRTGQKCSDIRKALEARRGTV